VRTGGPTYVMNLISALRNFAKAPESFNWFNKKMHRAVPRLGHKNFNTMWKKSRDRHVVLEKTV